MSEKWLSVKDYAAAVKHSQSHVYNQIRIGIIPKSHVRKKKVSVDVLQILLKK